MWAGKWQKWVLLGVGVCLQASAFNCPLTFQEPSADKSPIDPLMYELSQENNKSKKMQAACDLAQKSLSEIFSARDKLLAFNEKTLSPAPTDSKKEVDKLSEQVTDSLMLGINDLIEAIDAYLVEGKRCSGVELAKGTVASLNKVRKELLSEKTAIAAARATYASSGTVRNVAATIDNVVRLSRDIPNAFRDTLILVSMIQERREESFKKSVCKYWKDQLENRCARPPKAGSTLEPHREKQLRAKIRAHKKVIESGHASYASSGVGALRLCALAQVGASGVYQEECGAFQCQGLLSPTPETPDSLDRAFCTFTKEYQVGSTLRRAEISYEAGFKIASEKIRDAQATKPRKVYGQTARQPRYRKKVKAYEDAVKAAKAEKFCPPTDGSVPRLLPNPDEPQRLPPTHQ